MDFEIYDIYNGVDCLRLNERIPIRLATWNIKNLYQPGKIENQIQEMTRMKIHVLSISVIQWVDTEKLTTKNGMMYYAGNGDSADRYGVAMLLDKINKLAPSPTQKA